MADEPIDTEAETLENTETEELEDQGEGSEEQGASEEEGSDDSGEEETVIGFGDEDDPDAEKDDDSAPMKTVRSRNRELTKQLREKDRELAEIRANAAKPAQIEVGPKPTLESCDFDEEKFEAALDDWKDRKVKAAEQEEQTQAASRKVQESYTRDLQAYETRKNALGVSDDQVEAVAGVLSLEQQAVAIQAAKDPAALVVALSKSPTRLAELAKIDNPWKLAAEIARMEGNVKITTSRKAPAPNRPERGSASMQAANSDKELERLEKEAEKTGVRTAVIAYKKQLREKNK